MNYSNSSSILFCEWLFELLVPNFYSHVHNEAQGTPINEYVLYRLQNHQTESSHQQYVGSEQKQEQQQLLINTCLTSLKNITNDLLNHYNTCMHFESNLIYIMWLLNLFLPLLSTLFIILFVLPLVICLCVYASSVYLFVTKLWRKFKVNFCSINQINFSFFI